MSPHRFTKQLEGSQTYHAGEVMALMEISHQKGEESAMDKAEKLARLTAFRVFWAGFLTGAGCVLLYQVIA